MSDFKKTLGCFCLLFIIPTVIMAGCQTVTPSVEPAWKTFTNQECAYEFRYPSEARVEIMDKNTSQLKVDVGTGEPFQVTCAREYSPGDALHYLDTQVVGERKIGDNLWSEYSLPGGYCDAVGCSAPLYALQMESGEVLYTVTFYSQETTTALQEEILSTFRIADTP